jgi:hypothetical protein
MTKNKGTMLVLGGHGVFGSMIGAAAEAAGWTAIRTSRRPASVTLTWLSRTRWRR